MLVQGSWTNVNHSKIHQILRYHNSQKAKTNGDNAVKDTTFTLIRGENVTNCRYFSGKYSNFTILNSEISINKYQLTQVNAMTNLNIVQQYGHQVVPLQLKS
jgi:hypothetical protein